ncbi:LicD family protein, partial [Candidatus Pacearchaeota archaeon]|nr:LicD family protein [Candidatus Pacearchaeota archaeon]
MKEATGIRILKTIDKIMKNWFILHGTLLGLIRDGKFISWDHDLDFAIEYKNWNDKILLDLKKEFIIAKKSCFRRNALKYVGDNKIGKLTKLRLADKETNLHFCLEIYHEGIGEYKNYMYFQ